ncbi:hypothetical protein KCU93_g184, partial [Aureobasidium melanogenum]
MRGAVALVFDVGSSTIIPGSSRRQCSARSDGVNLDRARDIDGELPRGCQSSLKIPWQVEKDSGVLAIECRSSKDSVVDATELVKLEKQSGRVHFLKHVDVWKTGCWTTVQLFDSQLLTNW